MIRTSFARVTDQMAAMPRPRFAAKVESVALKLPPGKMLGSVVGIANAPNGDYFVLQDVAWANPILPPETQLPPVVHFDKNFTYLHAWGGPEQLPRVNGVSQWPAGLDNIECDEEGNLWIGGYGAEDDAALRFSPDGRLLLRIGERGHPGSDSDTEWLHGPVSFCLNAKTREVFIGDGYGNHRVIGFNVDSGKFTRMWGAYGKPPTPPAAVDKSRYGSDANLPPAPQSFGNPVHRVTRAPDGRLYVADRTNCRVQEFEVTATEARFVREVIIAPGTLVMGSAWDIAFSADAKYIFVADGMNLRVWTVDRASMTVLGWTTTAPEHEGDDNVSTHRSVVHRIAVQPNGDLLLARTTHGLQRLKYLGIH
jgi:hypothetical protein